MKLNAILESQLKESPRWDAMDQYQDDLERFMEIRHQEDFTSIYDALDGYLGDDDWPEFVNTTLKRNGMGDMEDLKMDNRDVDTFRRLAVGPNGETGDVVKAAKKVKAMDYDDWRDSDEAEEYVTIFHDWEAEKRDRERDFHRRG